MPEFYFIDDQRHVTKVLAPTPFHFNHTRCHVDSDEMIFRTVMRRARNRRGGGNAKYRNLTVFSLNACNGVTVVVPMQHQFCAVFCQCSRHRFRIVQGAPETRPSS